MFLKRLELQGFKSFADKTVLEFGSGVTSVVGPNGSGKSNISDAIRWVMGEMSAKSLRGSNMQDVIFAGTEKRKPVNYAEVSLVLDNTDHVFPVEYDEVIVTRRVFRSGETAYQINRNNCRLKDIHELFMDTGLGRDGYSIIGQGNVAQILSTKAEDRRSLFEEAAGVSKYRYKKEEALRKLGHTEENLVRIGDIAAELESQLTPLKNQSEKARKYLVLYEEFKALDVDLSHILLLENEAKKQEADKLFNDVSDELSALREKESETEAKIAGLYDQSKQKDDEQQKQNEKLIETQSRMTECAKEISIAENNINNNLSISKRISDEIRGLEEKNVQKKQQIAVLTENIGVKEQEIQERQEEFAALKAGEDSAETEQTDTQDEIDSYKGKIIQSLNQIASTKEKIAGIEKLREDYKRRLRGLEEEISSFEQGLDRTKEEMRQDQEQIAEKQRKNDSLKKQISDLKKTAEGLQLKKSEIAERGNALKVEFNSKMSKQRILEDMENDYEGYAKSVKAVLKSQEMRKRSIYGTVAGLIDVDKKYAVAVEMALGGALQNIVVEDEQDAKAAIAFLRSTHSGRATFLPISSVHGRTIDNLRAVSQCPGFLGVASDLIRYNSKYDGIMKNLLGRVVVVDTMDNGIALSRKFSYKFRTVTLEGDILNAGGSMSGGSINKTGSFLSRAADIKTLKAETAQLDRDLKALREEFARNEEEIKSVQLRLNTMVPVSREHEDEILRLSNTIEHLEKMLSGSGETKENYLKEQMEIEQLLSDSTDESVSLLNTIRSEENRMNQHNELVNELNQKLEAILENRRETADQIMQYTLMISGLKRDVEESKNNISALQSEIEHNIREIEPKKTDAAQMVSNNGILEKNIEEKRSLIGELELLTAELKKQIQTIAGQKEKIVERLQEIQRDNKDLTDTLMNLQKELSRAEARQSKLDMERENLINRLWEDYEMTPSEIREKAKPVENQKESAARLGELKKSIKGLGSVNMDAIEEYKSVSERYEFLSSQRADLEKSKSDLNKIIASMEELMKEHFGRQFSIINESFSQVFTELFGGGKGKLYLQDPDNILESGIEIEVQLPGKGLQNINLYSGGEKSFIAIALLFAILKVKPTPFCILDEIDAALDDVNVSRFATYLKNYLDQSQFIVITHRRGTMEAANIMYGITMQEKGVSKLLSLHIDDVDDDMVS